MIACKPAFEKSKFEKHDYLVKVPRKLYYNPALASAHRLLAAVNFCCRRPVSPCAHTSRRLPPLCTGPRRPAGGIAAKRAPVSLAAAGRLKKRGPFHLHEERHVGVEAGLDPDSEDRNQQPPAVRQGVRDGNQRGGVFAAHLHGAPVSARVKGCRMCTLANSAGAADLDEIRRKP